MHFSHLQLSTFIAVCLLLAGCGSTGGDSVKKTLDNPKYTDYSYGDILVIGIGGDYDDRAYFERAMVSRIKTEGAAASAWYTVVGRNQPVARTTVSTAVKSRGFDAVLLARLISQKVSRKDSGRAIDLFRYDYEELTMPGTINILTTVTISAEMFYGPDETRMWAIESTVSNKGNTDQIIDSAAETIVAQLKKDRLIGR